MNLPCDLLTLITVLAGVTYSDTVLIFSTMNLNSDIPHNTLLPMTVITDILSQPNLYRASVLCKR